MFRKDSLTGLYGRDYLYAHYEEFKNSDSKAILIDFRNLKYINDNHGHMIGDQILRFLANNLSIEFPKSILTRLGGDEFLIITNFSNEDIIDKLQTISNKLITNFNNKLKLDVSPFNSGIVDTKISFDMTYSRADLAMYDAKNKEKLYSFFEQWMQDQKEYESSYVSQMKDFIQTENFYYQEREVEENLIDLTLLDQNYSQVFTKDKSDILKKHNLTQTLDLYNNRVIINQILDNQKTYIINIYHKTLLDNKYIDLLDMMLSSKNIDRNRVCINVNTHGYTDDPLLLIIKLNELKSLGVKTSIGNVSLDNQQTLLPILAYCNLDYIKIESDVFYEAINNKDVLIVIKGMLYILERKNIRPIAINLDEKDYNHDLLKEYNVLVRKKTKRV